MSHQLRITGGPATGQVLPISAGYLYSIGRGAEAQLSIPSDQTLSRAHAEVYFDQTNNAWLLKNKSQHGTLLNGEVFNDHRYIQAGASFQVGGSMIQFDLAGAAAPAVAPVMAQAPGHGGGAPAAAGGFGAPAAGGFGAPAGGAPAAAGGFGAPAAGAPAAAGGFGAPAGDPTAGGYGAPAGDPAAGGYGAPAAAGSYGAPVGGEVAAPGAHGGGAAKAEGPGAGAQAGAAFGSAAGALANLGGGGPVTIAHSGEGFPYKDLVMGGLSLVKANLIPSLALIGPTVALFMLGILLMKLISVSIGGLVVLVGQLTMLSLWITLPNYLRGLRTFQETGQAMSIKSLLDFSDIPLKIKAMVCGAAGNFVFGLGSFALYAQLENPNAGLVDCIKLGYKFGLKNLVPMIILAIVLGVVVQIGFILIGLGAVVTMPVGICAHYLAYSLKKDELAALAGAEGISLG